MKKQMKQVAAATLAALCFGAVAIPTVASAATITIEAPASMTAASTTYNVYKVFEVTTTDNVQTIVAGSFADGVVDYFKTLAGIEDGDSDATIASKIGDYLNEIGNDSPEARALAADLFAIVGDDEVAANGTLDATGNATITVQDAGYYLVTASSTFANGEGDDDNETVVSALMLNTANAEANITLKADKPTIEKKIVETNGLVDANTAGVGETVTYLLKSNVPDTTYYSTYTFTMTDTLSSGLTFDGSDNVIVWIEMGNDTTYDTSDVALTLNTDYTVDTANGIVINFLTMKDLGTDSSTDTVTDANAYAGKTVYVQYTATVNENAVIGEEGNPNKVKLTYSNDPTWDADGDGEQDKDENTPTTEETPEDEVITYLTEIKIHKQDASGTAMPNVSFTLTGENHKVTYYVTVEGGKYTVTTQADGANNADDTPASVTVLTDDEGNIIFSGLTEDTYTITENACEGNEGYILADPVKIEITAKFDSAADPTAAPTWLYNGDELADEATIFTETIINKKGTTLPSTGGIGTTIFTVVGLSLMATAAGAYFIKRKVTAQ